MGDEGGGREGAWERDAAKGVKRGGGLELKNERRKIHCIGDARVRRLLKDRGCKTSAAHL